MLRSIGVSKDTEEKFLFLIGDLMEEIQGTSFKPTPKEKYLEYLKKIGD